MPELLRILKNHSRYKKQGERNLNEKGKSAGPITEVDQTLELSQDYREGITKFLQRATQIVLEEIKK